jgi:hypothetical protein
MSLVSRSRTRSDNLDPMIQRSRSDDPTIRQSDDLDLMIRLSTRAPSRLSARAPSRLSARAPL